jgi:hypothetical protein
MIRASICQICGKLAGDDASYGPKSMHYPPRALFCQECIERCKTPGPFDFDALRAEALRALIVEISWAPFGTHRYNALYWLIMREKKRQHNAQAVES